ncbi:hypothetical protein Cgig2_021720 [Carnegiea gigantea]|uniref:Mitotic checkpoint serine/threonine-protein kinase BUB1 n=1 Tax=Carnegiea gigantea TaxID=171969 RepID=A0A9Q1GYV5_9CARY|nr:hypothetical protein Cgig2_021720 [Carnegiea gigantea]
MAVVSSVTHYQPSSTPSDPILPSIKNALHDFKADPSKSNRAAFEKLVSDCVTTFKSNPHYQNDLRFLKVWFLYMDCIGDFERVYGEMEEYKICFDNSMLYETCALFLEAKGRLLDAHRIYRVGISRNAEPIERLKKSHSLFLRRVQDLVNACSMHQNVDRVTKKLKKSRINPWSPSTVDDLLPKILPQLAHCDGYHYSSREYPGKVALSTLNNSSRNKMIKVGGWGYQIKGCAGQGGFAQVFKAYVNSDPDEVVALKIQKPPFPWEFYMYHQLDMRIPSEERSSFGSAQRLHHYADYSILVCEFLSHGTLQDAINSYLVVGTSMEEVLCIYYTIEMLRMLECLHGAGIIHGDFKPDNLLIRYSREDLTIDEEDFVKRRGPWHNQGLCLVDWGRGIDLNLFPADAEFIGDCRTSGFRCIEMQEDKPWTFQVDTYGLCVVAHMMLHGSYMEIEKNMSSDGSYYRPKSHFKRYWNTELWKNLFRRLLNGQPFDDHMKTLQELRESFQQYMLSSPAPISKLKQLLLKQRSSLCSA